jgi:DNA-binding MurR/RpiR family transcriptional regulator
MESALFAIREYLPVFPEAERRVAEYVLAEPRRVLHYNVAELSRQSGVSQAAVVRFCRRIGTDSYADFKMRLSHDVFKNSDERFVPDLELESDSKPVTVVKGIIGGLQRSLARLETMIDIHALESASLLVTAARTTCVFGVGASGLVAQDLYQKLLRIGLPCIQSADTDMQITTSCNLRPGDVAFVISYSGETPAMAAVARQARQRGAPVISLTMDGDNTIKSLADIALVVPALERVYRTGATTSRVNQLAVVDMLYGIIISRNLNEAIAAIERTMAATHRERVPE